MKELLILIEYLNKKLIFLLKAKKQLDMQIFNPGNSL
jgi:16S rRNA G527 N7-methylase RsmG